MSQNSFLLRNMLSSQQTNIITKQNINDYVKTSIVETLIVTLDCEARGDPKTFRKHMKSRMIDMINDVDYLENTLFELSLLAAAQLLDCEIRIHFETPHLIQGKMENEITVNPEADELLIDLTFGNSAFVRTDSLQEESTLERKRNFDEAISIRRDAKRRKTTEQIEAQLEEKRILERRLAALVAQGLPCLNGDESTKEKGEKFGSFVSESFNLRFNIKKSRAKLDKKFAQVMMDKTIPEVRKFCAEWKIGVANEEPNIPTGSTYTIRDFCTKFCSDGKKVYGEISLILRVMSDQAILEKNELEGRKLAAKSYEGVSLDCTEFYWEYSLHTIDKMRRSHKTMMDYLIKHEGYVKIQKPINPHGLRN